MPLPKAHPTDPPETFTEVRQLLARTDDVVGRSTARMIQANVAMRKTHQENVQYRKQLDELHEAIGAYEDKP